MCFSSEPSPAFSQRSVHKMTNSTAQFPIGSLKLPSEVVGYTTGNDGFTLSLVNLFTGILKKKTRNNDEKWHQILNQNSLGFRFDKLGPGSRVPLIAWLHCSKREHNSDRFPRFLRVYLPISRAE